MRVVTNKPRTVTIVIVNSHEMAHGTVKGDESAENDDDAYTTRIIPFITRMVHNWMEKNPYIIYMIQLLRSKMVTNSV